MTRVRWVRVLTVALYVLAVLVFLFSARRHCHRNTGCTELIAFGDRFEHTRLPAVLAAPHAVHLDSPGYDGQWYAQLAVEPLLRNRDLDRALDTPQYRARRILFAWTAYVFGRGQPKLILRVYAVQNIVAWLLLAGILLRWFPPTSARNFAAWFGCLYGIGMAVSFRFALLEGPGMVIIALGVWAMERQRPWLAAGLLGVAGLGRETNVLAGTLLVDRIPRDWRAWATLAAKSLVVVVPFFLWLAYIRSVYPATNLSNPDSFGVPFSGYVEKWVATLSELYLDGWGTFARFNLAAMAGLTVQIGYLLWRREWGSAWWRVGAIYCALMPFLSYLVWEGYPGAFPRVLLPVSFAFNVLVVESRWFWPLVILGNLSVWHGLPMIGVPFLTGFL